MIPNNVILNGRSEEQLKQFPDNHFDSCVTDPNYGLSFMGMHWDYDVPTVELWKEVLRVLKPGGHLLSFGGTRTYHRLVVRIEDAGFEIRDQLQWIYGSGFPKSLNVFNQIKELYGNEKCDCLDQGIGCDVRTNIRCKTWEVDWMHRNTSKSPKENIEYTILAFQEEGGSDVMRLLWKIYQEKTKGSVEIQKSFLLQDLRKQFSKEKGFRNFEIWARMEEVKRNCQDERSEMYNVRENAGTKQWSSSRTSQTTFQIWWDEFIVQFNKSLRFMPSQSGNINEQDFIIDSNKYFDRELIADNIIRRNGITAKRCSWCGRFDLTEFFGLGSGLKPANEPICLARKPLSEKTITKNVLKHGTGAINIDDCKIPFETIEDLKSATWGRGTDIMGGNYVGAEHSSGKTNIKADPKGRWPSNVIMDEEAAALLDRQTGILKSGVMKAGTKRTAPFETRGGYHGGFPEQATEQDTYGDFGGASRFFYCAKASRSERNKGLEAFEKKMVRWSSGEQNPGSFQSEGTERNVANYHPTVKPITLIRYLVRLITPPGGICLDPFGGSGTGAIACGLEGMNYVLIDQSKDYVAIGDARVEAWKPEFKQLELF